MKLTRSLFPLFVFTVLNGFAASPGQIDPAFNADLLADGKTRAAVVDANGGIIVVGEFREVAGNTVSRIVRLTSDGAVDTSFNTGSGANNSIAAIEILSNGQILLGGKFTQFNGAVRHGLVLLNSDGSVDASFVSRFKAEGFSEGVHCLEQLADGGIMIGGYFTEYNGQPVGRLVKIDATGDIATGFATGAGADSHIYDVDELADGKVIVSGFFHEFSGHPTACVARLHANGAPDTTFTTGDQLDTVAYTVAVQQDGKIIAGGYFSIIADLGKGVLVRLNRDGSLDETFQALPKPNSNVYSLQVDDRDRILAAGQFKSIGEADAPGLMRLHADGSFDPTFSAAHDYSVSFVQEFPFDESGNVMVYGNSALFGDIPVVERVFWDPLSASDEWLVAHFGANAPNNAGIWLASPAGDAVPNLLKYALAYRGDPRQPVLLWDDSGLLRALWRDGMQAGFYFTTDAKRDDVEIVVERSTTLSKWEAIGVSVVEHSRDGDLIVWQVTTPVSDGPIFFRLRATLLDKIE